MHLRLREVDRVEIWTLQDNYIDVAAMDSTETVQRALPVQDMEVKKSILAEHGFSAVVTVSEGGTARSVLFDFGFSENGAALNAEALGVDMGGVEAMVLSHGHMDHFGGLVPLAERVGRKGIELYLHPAALRSPRRLKVSDQIKLLLPPLTRERLREAGVTPVETKEPTPLLEGGLLYLGEIPRTTAFERGFPRMVHEEDGVERPDPIEDDTSLVAHLKGKGLVILSGCAHAGIVNTVLYAREVTGIEEVHVVMGGFHLTGTDFEPIVEPTVEALQALGPRYVVPTHCTGRKAIQYIERKMPEQFLLNMSGTKMVFAA